MNGAPGKYPLLSLLCLMLAVTAGCAEFTVPAWIPWNRQTDTHPGVIPPAERIANLKELARSAPSAGAEEKTQIAARLADSIRTERDPLIRAEIVRTLGSYPGAASDSVLSAAMEDPHAEVRTAGCEAWGRRGGPQAVAVLAKVLDNESHAYVRLAAARALGRTKDSAAVAVLGKALGDEDPALQRRAVLSLKQVTGEDFGNDVRLWQQYVRGERPQPPEPVSIAERLRQMF